MKKFVYMLLLMGVTASSCTIGQEASVEITSTSSTTQPAVVEPAPEQTTTTIAIVDADVEEVSTTTTVFVDYADPVGIRSKSLDLKYEPGKDYVTVSTQSVKNNRNYPLEGEVMWIKTGSRQAGPCEAGPVLMASHLNTGEPFFNLVDDSPRDNHGKKDYGLKLGDLAGSFVLADGTICEYTVIEPIGLDIANVNLLESQTGIYFLKDEEVMNPILNKLNELIGDQPILMMWVSYGGPDASGISNGHRLNNAVVFAELTRVVPGPAR